MEMKKAQSAMEFMMIVGGVMFFFLGFLFVLEANIAEKTKENRIIAVNEVALGFQNEVKIASDAGDGYRRNFTLPPSILTGIEYDLTIIGNSVYINTSEIGLALPLKNVTGQPIIGNNYIRNINGSVYLN